ncbi:hypothetical protein POSPLADRAFT_1048390 [Postia placenta MAD-698-R-SB12]|uniref:F-box domain-containing protein n=1 Tax=Postia placenta MAD-698-R-SB12 TaxID=670580 RepID=A0A1X6MUL0_9APHY|nr:hypothetical protein POSPLADRAFT_1048390 [Postia placenta MAD-698-R-SB12]OSX59940.1 hypothetical protein POSPLADRAFT_1048390 [Postia placenta MAD-698-R-SB12]
MLLQSMRLIRRLYRPSKPSPCVLTGRHVSIDFLPDEILEAIFLFGCDESRCNVCNQEPTEDVPRLRRYLERSRTRPIDLSIALPVAARAISLDSLSDVMDKLLLHLLRWRELHVESPFEDVIRLILTKLAQPALFAVALEVLDVRRPIAKMLVPGSQPLPALRSFAVASAAWTLSDLGPLALSSPLLTHLSIRSSYAFVAHAPLHFPALKTLQVGDCYQNDTILRQLHAPNLEELHIEEMEIIRDETAGRYVDALRDGNSMNGRFPKLRSLKLHISEDSSPLILGRRLGPFLTLFPSIKHLILDGCHVSHFLKGLADLHSEVFAAETLLPNLEHIALGSEYGTYVMDNAHSAEYIQDVITLVKARHAAGVPLKRFSCLIARRAATAGKRRTFLRDKHTITLFHGLAVIRDR